MKLFPVTVEANYRDSSVIALSLQSLQNDSVPAGALLLGINGRPVKEITGEMLRYVSGEKIFYRTVRLNHRFAPLHFLLYGDTVFDVEYRVGNKTALARLNGISYDESREAGRLQINKPGYNFSMNADQGIAILQFDSFEDYDGLKSFIDSAFTLIQQQKTDQLIIDIRRNGGGDSRVADELFQYISPVPFQQFGKLVENRSPRLRRIFREQYGYDFGDTLSVAQFEGPPLNALRENPKRYHGTTWLLTSHTTYSAAADMAWAFQYFGMGTVVGEETGGLAVCFGAAVEQKLPRTGLEYGVSYKHFYNYGATEENRHGVRPDHNVPAVRALEYTLLLIGDKKP